MRERSRPARARRSALVFLLITVLVNAALFIAPLTEPPGTVDFGEDGGANIIDKGDVTSRINPIARPIYVFGDATCHQKASRSFFINGNQMPVCSRDVGVYLGLTLGALVYLLFPRRFSFLWLFVLIVPLALDGLVQLLTPYESNNAVRLVTGLMYGGVVSMLIVQIMYEIHEVPLRRFGPEVHIERALGIVRPRPRDIHRPGEGDGLDAAWVPHDRGFHRGRGRRATRRAGPPATRPADRRRRRPPGDGGAGGDAPGTGDEADSPVNVRR